MDAFQYLTKTSEETLTIQRTFLQEHGKDLVEAARLLGQCLGQGGKILVLGNGGSAADAQHMAAEMTGRMLVDRRPLAAVALTTDTSALTAIGNDYGFEQVFLRQMQALARPEDAVVAISTSGNSRNVLLAVDEAQRRGCRIIGLTGGQGGELKARCHLWLNVSAGKSSSRIQESHIFAIHSMVDLLDRYFLPKAGAV
jgi:D-sedoheptulose 7-phosphate isomerase